MNPYTSPITENVKPWDQWKAQKYAFIFVLLAIIVILAFVTHAFVYASTYDLADDWEDFIVVWIILPLAAIVVGSHLRPTVAAISTYNQMYRRQIPYNEKLDEKILRLIVRRTQPLAFFIL